MTKGASKAASAAGAEGESGRSDGKESTPASVGGSGVAPGVVGVAPGGVGGGGGVGVGAQLPQPDRELARGARVCFHFDQGKFCGTYVGPSKRKQDKHQGLHRVRWDDGGGHLVQLSDERRFDGTDVAEMERGEWAIVGFATADSKRYYRHAGEVYACDARLDELIFARDFDGIDGLFVPVMAAKKSKLPGENGPFTLKQVMRMDDWPQFQKAAEVELDTIESNHTWDLADENEAINQGAYIYDTRYVFTRKRDGKHKARFVLRGDQQVWSDWEDDVDDDEADGTHEDTSWYVYEDDHGERPGPVDAEGDEDAGQRDLGEERQPRCNWVESELAANKFDKSITLEARIEELKRAGIDYDEVTASHWTSRPSERAELDGRLPWKKEVKANHGDVFAQLAQAKAGKGEAFGLLNHKVANTYRQLFAPVMTQTVMFVLLAVAVANDEHLFVADIKGAFLYAMLLPEEVVYCRPPKGYENHPRFKGKIMRLRKALYGLAQAPRRWFQHMVQVLEKYGLKRTVIDPCLFVLITGSFILKAGTHVDDFLFATNDKDRFEQWFGEVKKELNISSMDHIGMNGVDYMSLWMTYNMARDYLLISQKGYIEKALRMFGFHNMKSAATPMATGVKFTKADMPAVMDERRRDIFRRLLGVARWISRNSTPEATFAVSYLACFLENPSAAMVIAATQIFRYFKWTIENDVEGRCFRASSDGGGVVPPGFKHKVKRNNVYGYIDATYLSEERSLCRYGVVYFVNTCTVFELSRRLPDIALSSTESEYVGMSLGVREGYYIRMVLEAMNEAQHGPLLVGQDNKSCIQIVENPGRHHGRTKHLDVHLRWIEREYERERLALVYVNTEFMVADVLTKALAYERHARHTSAMKGHKMPEKEKKAPKKRKVAFEETDQMES